MSETIIRIPGKLVASEYGTKLANVSDLDNNVYGPYTSVTAAHTALSAAGLNTIATTVGIIDDNNEVKEYWYQGGTEQVNLVKKVLGKENDAVSFDGFIILEPVTIIEGSAFEPDAILYSRNVNRFVAKKGNNYYDNWEERGLYNNGNEPYTSKLYPYNGKSYTWNGTTFEAEGADAVRFEAQTLTAQQKEQAAQNIGLDSVVKGDVQQSLSDAQRIQAQNNMMGKAYSSVAADHSGLGKVYLAKNNGVLTQAMMPIATQENEEDPGRNTVYIIQYDYVLDENITIPAGCTLQFDGGSISGAGAGANTITGANTVIKAEHVAIFNGITIAGTWNVPDIYSVWFSDIFNDNVVKNLVRLSSSDIKNNIYMAAGTYNASIAAAGESILALKSNTTLYNSGNIVLAATAYDSYRIVFINNVENVKVIGGTYTGDMSSHIGDAGQYGHAISIMNARQVTIDAVTCTNCWGDPLYLFGSSEVLATNFKFIDSRRNGCSIIGGCSNIELAGGLIQSIKGTNPKSAVDIEPNEGEDTISNVYVHDISVVDCPVGVKIYNRDEQFAHSRNVVFENILIDNQAVNCIDFENADGAIVRNLTASSGNIKVVKSTNISITGSHFYTGNITLHAHNEKEGSIEFIGNVIKTTVRIRCNINGTIVRNNSFIINGDYYTRFEHVDGYTYTKRNVLENNYFENNPTADNAVDRVVNLAISDVLLSDNTVSSSKKVNNGIVGDSSSAVSVNTKQLGTNLTSVTNSLWSNNSKLYPLMGNTRPTYENGKDFGAQFYDISIRKPIWWRNNQWLDANGEDPDAPHHGTWANRPVFDNVNRGFMYFNTDSDYPIFAGNSKFVTALGFTTTKMKGTTAERPTQYLNTTTDVGFIYLDQTLNKPIWWTGDTSNGKSGWVDATGADMPNT